MDIIEANKFLRDPVGKPAKGAFNDEEKLGLQATTDSGLTRGGIKWFGYVASQLAKSGG